MLTSCSQSSRGPRSSLYQDGSLIKVSRRLCKPLNKYTHGQIVNPQQRVRYYGAVYPGLYCSSWPQCVFKMLSAIWRCVFLIYILALLTVNRAFICLAVVHSCTFCLPFHRHLISIALNGKPITRLVLRVASANDLQPDTSFLLIRSVNNNQPSAHFLPLLPWIFWKEWLQPNQRHPCSTLCCQQASCRQEGPNTHCCLVAVCLSYRIICVFPKE